MDDVDFVVASLSGELDKEATVIAKAMTNKNVKRLVCHAGLKIV